MRVKVNCFELEFVGKSMELVQYKVRIVPAVRQKKLDEHEKFNGEFEFIPNKKRGDVPIDIERGSELSRRILRQLNQDLGNKFTHDGSSTAYAYENFFKDPVSTTETFVVTVKKDCDPDEPDANLVKNAHFLVHFSHPIARVITSIKDFEQDRRALDVIVNSSMTLAGMKAFGRNPKAFYFPEQNQHEVIKTRKLLELLNKVSSMVINDLYRLLTVEHFEST